MGHNPAPLNQLNEPTRDNQADENPQNNCVFASGAWIVRDLGSETDCVGDELHDECEGQGATGPYDPTNPTFLAAMARRGVQLTIFRGTGPQLVAKLHDVLSNGGDALINIPSQWGTPISQQKAGFSTHCVAIAYALAGPGLRAMNPWGGFMQDGSDTWWADRICYGYILIATPITAPLPAAPTGGSTLVATPMLDINNATVAQFFYLTPTGTWHSKLTNQEIGNGFLATYRGMALSAPGMGTLNALALLGLPLTGELNPFPGMSVQIFERGALVWDPKRQLDNPPGAGDTYFAHINSGPVLDFLTSGTQQQLATATAALSAAQAQVATVQRQAQDAVSAAQASAAQAQQALATAQAQAQADATSAAAQITSATAAQTAAEAQATQAQHDLEAAQAQVASMQQQVADAAKGLAIVSALKAAMA